VNEQLLEGGAPRVLGIDDDGREILSSVELERWL
jgi:hypothetical protein